MKIGFIGTGIMGSGMIHNLLAADYTVNVFNRTKKHADSVIKQGAIWQESVAELTKNSDVIISIVGFPKDVEEVYFSDEGILTNSHAGQTVIDMTTSSPILANRIALEAETVGVTSLDAPVSGGDVGAQQGTLTIMVGGDKDIYQKMQPVFNAMGSSINRFGEAGMGQHAKMANQIMIAGTMTGMIESLVYADKVGLDKASVIDMTSGGAAQNWSMDNYGPRVLKGDYQPGFMAKHFLKDLRIVLTVANDLNLELPGTTVAEQLYDKMVQNPEWADLGTQGLIKLYESQNDKKGTNH
ncbi:NAD(P)-dependent oxidoreductase [Lentilactobacillus sp. SPB1-3]|uniref:NAD(P)-dependent oxidoreductase n=1 Tax=Lentilactobacillus terminaliae TaxID=3003483 RepID=A0ACD5DDP3_9LACO|nr:NAD(P)-dependent oxidoreductase [Lentilactobacillus sp. SPB1-3]MCZ0977797.1 NAD(P)-dependent oxidoreductase [Lentilactobacillus sp. SPB1-3]